jgi:hypothetical protein
MTTLSERAMIVELSVHLPQRSKHEKGLSAEIAHAHGTDSEMTKVTKQLFAKQSVKRLSSAATALRIFWESKTLSWGRGKRILPSDLYFDCMMQHGALACEFALARAEFLDDLDAIKAEAQRRLNGTYNESDYPSAERLEQRIGIELDVYALPDERDWRVSLGDDEEQRIKDQIADATERRTAEMIRELWGRVYDVVGHPDKGLLGKLERYTEDGAGKVIATFRDSALQNLRDVVDVLGPLNITHDPELESMRQRLAAGLCQQEAEALRDSQPLRESAIDECKAVLDTMRFFCGDTELDMAAE